MRELQVFYFSRPFRLSHHLSILDARRSSAMDVNRHARNALRLVRNVPGCRPKTELH